MNDKKLMKQLKKRNLTALETVINTYEKYVTYIISQIVGYTLQKEDIQEIVADVFISLWKNSENLNPDDYNDLKPYIKTIAINMAKNKLRRNRQNIFPLNEDILLIEKDIEDDIIRKELKDILREVLRYLSDEDQYILIRYYYQGAKIKDITHDMSLSESNIKSRLMRSRTKLKKLLEERGYYNGNQII